MDCKKKVLLDISRVLGRISVNTLNLLISEEGFGATGKLNVEKAHEILPRPEMSIKALKDAKIIRQKGVCYELTPVGQELVRFIKKSIEYLCTQK